MVVLTSWCSKEFLHRPNIIAIFEQMRSKGVTERVTAASLRDVRSSYGLLYGLLQDSL
jgi:hypothetical protein